MTIEELAERLAVTPRTIRFYTAESLLPEPRREGKRLFYDREHAVLLRVIRLLKDKDLTIAGIRRQLRTHSMSDLQHALGLDDASDRAEPEEPARLADRIDHPSVQLAAVRNWPDEDRQTLRPGPHASRASALSAVMYGRQHARRESAAAEPDVWCKVTIAEDVEVFYRATGDADREASVLEAIEMAAQYLMSEANPEENDNP